MAEVLMTLEACRCLPLGVQTPAGDVVAAAIAHRIDVVALSFTGSLDAADAQAALRDLHDRLPPSVAIWAGGGASALRTVELDRLLVVPRLADIPEAVARWRGHGMPATDRP
jgi:hypothetical protein